MRDRLVVRGFHDRDEVVGAQERVLRDDLATERFDLLVHFLEAVALDRPVLVKPEQARQVMELYIAADLSAERNEPVRLPLQEPPA